MQSTRRIIKIHYIFTCSRSEISVSCPPSSLPRLFASPAPAYLSSSACYGQHKVLSRSSVSGPAYPPLCCVLTARGPKNLFSPTRPSSLRIHTQPTTCRSWHRKSTAGAFLLPHHRCLLQCSRCSTACTPLSPHGAPNSSTEASCAQAPLPRLVSHPEVRTLHCIAC
jgi:hypothetical protein